MSNEELLKRGLTVLKVLQPGREVGKIEPLGQGHINDTMLVSFSGGEPSRAVLQRLNPAVFPQPEKVMTNLAVLADHLGAGLAENPLPDGERWRVIRPQAGAGGQSFLRDEQGDFWRLISYVEGAVTREKLGSPEEARQAGRGLGVFHRQVADLDPARMLDTLPGFHVTPAYLAAYDLLDRGDDQSDDDFCRGMIEKHRELAPVLEEAAASGLLRQRVIHGDPRPANMLFDLDSGRVVALIDLDTVKPGLLHHDLGDLLRSCCNPSGDNPAAAEEVHFDLEICRQLLEGFLAEAGEGMTEIDYDLIYPALRLLTFELGLRFFSDHLAGNLYFRVERPGHNLDRALGQFRLLEAIEAKKTEICELVDSLRSYSRGVMKFSQPGRPGR